MLPPPVNGSEQRLDAILAELHTLQATVVRQDLLTQSSQEQRLDAILAELQALRALLKTALERPAPPADQVALREPQPRVGRGKGSR